MARSLSMLYAKNPKGSALDARSDLGYGRSSLKFTKPRQQASAYPYSMTDEQEEESEKIDDVEIDDVSLDFAAKVHRYLPVTDFYASAGTDPFYYAGAATKLSEELGKYVVSAGGIGMTLSHQLFVQLEQGAVGPVPHDRSKKHHRNTDWKTF